MIPLGLDEIADVMEARVLGESPKASVSEACIDSREVKPGCLFFALSGTKVDGHDFVDSAFSRGAFGCVVAREVESALLKQGGRALLLVEDVIGALGKLAAYHRNQQLAATVIAVTGSNGKTTVRAMIDHVLKARFVGRSSTKSFNNEIGLPLTLLSSMSGDQYLVAEIGANAPGEIPVLARMATPNIGVLTSIGEAHLEGFGSLEGVVREKLSMFDHLRPGGCAVLNIDHALLREHLAGMRGANVVTFGTHASADVRVTDIEPHSTGVRCRLNQKWSVEIPLLGAHNAVNAAGVFAVCRRMKMDEQEILDALRSCSAMPGRMNVRTFQGMTVLDDCYNANPTSMKAAIEVLKGRPATRRVAVVGDMRELGGQAAEFHEALGRWLAESGIQWVVAVGDQARAVELGVRSLGYGIQTSRYRDSLDAARELPGQLAAGDVVLVKGSRGVALEHVVSAIERQSNSADRGKVDADSPGLQTVTT